MDHWPNISLNGKSDLGFLLQIIPPPRFLDWVPNYRDGQASRHGLKADEKVREV